LPPEAWLENLERRVKALENQQRYDGHDMKPHRCPVCGGCGSLSIPPDRDSTSAVHDIRACRACKGTGIVWG